MTQNVDGLHEAAGSREVVDLHGRLDQVRCMQCDWRGGRQAWQDELAGLNPHWESLEASDAPDATPIWMAWISPASAFHPVRAVAA